MNTRVYLNIFDSKHYLYIRYPGSYNELDEIAWPEKINNTLENQLSGYNESDTDGSEIVNVNEVVLTISDLFNDWKSVQEYNHQCDPKTIELAPKNLRHPQLIIDKIEHYTTNG
uniref:Uncharacterized protein n=1 Tax=Rhizophagus irregularis (strain DAOM 181602 / DAOM 197198 / MUCL 43194) TaxID=747089 RepID=U9SQW5_RHIID